MTKSSLQINYEEGLEFLNSMTKLVVPKFDFDEIIREFAKNDSQKKNYQKGFIMSKSPTEKAFEEVLKAAEAIPTVVVPEFDFSEILDEHAKNNFDSNDNTNLEESNLDNQNNIFPINRGIHSNIEVKQQPEVTEDLSENKQDISFSKIIFTILSFLFFMYVFIPLIL